MVSFTVSKVPVKLQKRVSGVMAPVIALRLYNFPVNEFASKYFSGGGHHNASGGEYYDTLENAITYFTKVLKENEIQLNKEF